jgi:hypothetical protein
MSGINVIRRWVIQSRLKEQGKQGGVMITLPPKNFVDLNTSITADRLLRSGVDIDQLTSVAQVENLVNRINKLSTRVISQDDPRFKGIMESLMGKKGEVVDMTGKKIPPGSKIMGGKAMDDDLPPPGSRGGPDDIAAPVQSAEEATTNLMDSTIQKMLKMEPINAMKEANKVIKREGIYKALNQKQAKKILEDTEDHIFERNFKTPDDPDFDPEKMATGGIARIGLKDGMNRRTFLKFLGGAISLPIIGRFFKPAKGVSKVSKVPMIKTGDVPGKPEWFDQLVNRVIMEGDDVTKKFATKDREIVHTKKIDDNNDVTVYQDLDEGTIRVDYDSPSNMGEDTVSLQYKKPKPDEGDPRPTAEFEASELEPRYVGGPEDADIEFDGLGGGSSIKMLESDVSKLKEYATGQKPTLKEFVESKKRKDRVKAINEDTMEQAEYLSGKYGDGPEPDFDDIEDFARGGLAGMLGE